MSSKAKYFFQTNNYKPLYYKMLYIYHQSSEIKYTIKIFYKIKDQE